MKGKKTLGKNSDGAPIGDRRRFPRRTIIKGAAWSLPVIAAATGIPVAVASGLPACVTLPTTQAGWTLADPLSGRSQNAGATNIWRHVDGILGYRQKNDNFYRANNPAAVNYVTSLSTTFTAVAGTAYVFTFHVIGNEGASGAGNTPTTMDVVIGGSVAQRFSTRPLVVSGTQVPMAAVNATTGSQTFSVTWTAPSSGLTTFAFLFTMYPVSPTVQITYNDDIWVSPPTVTQPGGCA